MGDTKISWAAKVWNPVTGCTKVSDGCRNCYAERMSKRLAGRAGYPEDGFKVTLHPEKLDEPLRWKKPQRIFVCSMGDLFHEDVSLSDISVLFGIMFAAHWHTFLILTKRPERMLEFSNKVKNEIPLWPFQNVWLGVSVEDQKTADERIPLLLQTPAAKRFVSYEPALGPAIIPMFGKKYCEECKGTGWVSDHGPGRKGSECAPCECKPSRLDWVIMGGESGPGARPLHPDWARSTRDQCKEAGVPFFLKQLGEWEPDGYVPFKEPKRAGEVVPMYTVFSSAGSHECGKLSSYHIYDENGQGTRFRRVGKKAAGCLLDGKEHKERP